MLMLLLTTMLQITDMCVRYSTTKSRQVAVIQLGFNSSLSFNLVLIRRCLQPVLHRFNEVMRRLEISFITKQICETMS
jgi:hypothetical protein